MIWMLVLALLLAAPVARAQADDPGAGLRLTLRGHAARGSGSLHEDTEAGFGVGGALTLGRPVRGRTIPFRLTVDRTELPVDGGDANPNGSIDVDGEVVSTRIGLHVLLDVGSFAVGGRRAKAYFGLGLGAVFADSRIETTTRVFATNSTDVDTVEEDEILLLVATGLGFLLPLSDSFWLDASLGIDVGFADGAFQLYADSPEDSDPSALFFGSLGIAYEF